MLTDLWKTYESFGLPLKLQKLQRVRKKYTSAHISHKSTSSSELSVNKPQTITHNYIPCSLLFRIFGASSMSSVSRGKLSGSMMRRMLFPLTLSVSIVNGSLPLIVILTLLRCVFMDMSTPKQWALYRILNYLTPVLPVTPLAPYR